MIYKCRNVGDGKNHSIVGLGTGGGQAQDEDTVNALKQADLSECTTSNM
jgi:hypothetical protein